MSPCERLQAAGSTSGESSSSTQQNRGINAIRCMPFSEFWVPSTSTSAYKAEAPYTRQQDSGIEGTNATHGNDINELGGNDSLSTSVVLQLKGSNHVVGVLSKVSVSNDKIQIIEGRKEGPTLEAFSIACLLAEISAA